MDTGRTNQTTRPQDELVPVTRGRLAMLEGLALAAALTPTQRLMPRWGSGRLAVVKKADPAKKRRRKAQRQARRNNRR